MPQISVCLNCASEIRHGPFCELCGQRNVHARLALRNLVDDVKTQILEWNLPWLLTLREALLRPGQACRQYVDGKRVKFVNPLKYVVYLLTAILIVLNALPRRYHVVPDLSLRVDETTATIRDQPALAAWLTANPVALTLLLAPVIALVLRLLYSRDRYNNTEIVCWLFYVIGNALLLATVVHLGFEFYLEHVLQVVQASDAYFQLLGLKILLVLLAVVLHTIYSASGFFRERWFLTWIKILVVALIYFLLGTSSYYLLQQTGEPVRPWDDTGPVNLSSSLIGGAPWLEEERNLLAREDEAFVDAVYGEFLLATGRTRDALYRLLRADAKSRDSLAAPQVAGTLAVAYLRLERYDFALTQMKRYDTANLNLLRLDMALQQADVQGLPGVITESGILVDYNLLLAGLWRDGATEAALAEIRRVIGSPGTTIVEQVVSAMWAAALGDAQLAWSIFLKLESKYWLWPSLWMPYFSGVRQLADFKRYVREEGLEHYWRTTGNWADSCRPLGDDDFECF